MNTIQRKILFITAGVLVVMLLFPPFTSKYKGSTSNAGYSFILAGHGRSEVKVSLLGLQFLIVTTVGGILFLAFKGWTMTRRRPRRRRSVGKSAARESSDDEPPADDRRAGFFDSVWGAMEVFKLMGLGVFTFIAICALIWGLQNL